MIKKLTSRKFAMAIIMIIIMLIIAKDKNTACICATLISIVYMLSEAIVDKARAVKREVRDEAYVSKCVPCTEVNENENKW